MRVVTTFLSLALLCLLFLQCSERPSEPNPPDPEPNPPVVRTPADLTEQETSLLNSANKFGLSLFREIADRTPATKNIFVSPLSVSYALGLCYNGAEGDTREAIASTLQIAGLSVEEMNQAYHDLTQILIQTDALVDFRVGNSFWSKQGVAIQPEFIDLAQTYFEARGEDIDFQAPWAADTINAGVDRATNGKIDDMVQPPISPAVVAMLFNAIYFKGDWMFPFDTANTATETFYLADGSRTDCRMMSLLGDDHLMEVDAPWEVEPDTNATYYGNELLRAVSLPYGRGDFRMTVMVPNIEHDSSLTVNSIIEQLTTENWEAWLAGFYPADFSAELPRFRFKYEISLREVLMTLGMGIAFDPGQADFSNLFGGGRFWIDEVKQKSFIQVDEKGTEAAAVTQVIFVTGLPPHLLCNRPFLVVIHENVSGAILFIGKIANPVW